MNRLFLAVGVALVVVSCSGAVDVDPAAVLPGSWDCDDGIVVSFEPGGRYEWRVPPDDQLTITTEGNEQIRMNEDGGHSILDRWRLNGSTLEMDMLGETDRYALKFESESRFRMDGPDEFSCQRQ